VFSPAAPALSPLSRRAGLAFIIRADRADDEW